MSPKHLAVIVLVLAVLFAGGAVFPLQDAAGPTGSVLRDSSSSQRPLVVELPRSVPGFDPDNPQAIGIILVFHRWPDKDEQRIMLERTKEAGLTKADEIARFKMWLFQWDEWQKGETAEKCCRGLPELSSLECCEPDSLLGPTTGSAKE
jgi:hypothetical protein